MAAAFLTPLAFNPDRAVVWRTPIGSVDPDIFVAIPAVVSGNPHIALVWRGWCYFHWSRGRRADTYDDLSVGGANRKEEGADCGEKLLLHRSFSLNSSRIGREYGKRSCGA
jgi:hypothetical protein